MVRGFGQEMTELAERLCPLPWGAPGRGSHRRPDERGDLVVGDTLLLLMNAHHEVIPFRLPPLKKGQRWERVLDTAQEPLAFEGEPRYALQGRSMAVLHTTPLHQQAWQALGTTLLLSIGEPHAED